MKEFRRGYSIDQACQGGRERMSKRKEVECAGKGEGEEHGRGGGKNM